MLCFHDEHGHGCASGMLERSLSPTADAVSQPVAFLERELRVSAQGVCAELVDAVQCVIENGEEGTLLFAGDGERGAHFQPTPPCND